jgi:hypothetical protein
MRHPVDNPVFGSGFGPRKAPTPGASTKHLAQDYKQSKGTPVRAIADGVIEASFHTGPGGWWVHLRLFNGDLWGGCHLREKSPLKVGTRVEEGDVIAYVGNTGTATTGPHLHAIVLDNGTPVDPRKYIDGAATSTPAPKPNAPKPPTPPTAKDNDMRITSTDGSKEQWFHSGGFSRHIPNTRYLDILTRLVNGGRPVNAVEQRAIAAFMNGDKKLPELK